MTLNVKTMTDREKEIYKAGYKDGQDDALTMVSAVMAYTHNVRGRDVESALTQQQIIDVAEEALRKKGSKMTLKAVEHVEKCSGSSRAQACTPANIC